TEPSSSSIMLLRYSPSPPLRPRSGFGGARICTSSLRSSSYRPRKLDASANAPWTSTTVGEPLVDMLTPLLPAWCSSCKTDGRGPADRLPRGVHCPLSAFPPASTGVEDRNVNSSLSIEP